MATTDSGVTVPTGSDAFDPQGDMVTMADSLDGMIVYPVANTTARESYADALDADGVTQALVFRADATDGKQVEFCPDTSDSSTWHAIDARATDWTDITSVASLETGCTADGTDVPQVRINGGFLEFRGRINFSSALAAGSAIDVWVAPSGYRPAVDGGNWAITNAATANRIVRMQWDSGTYTLNARNSALSGGTSDHVLLDGVRWSLDA